ncbi:hypothetical protein BSL78_01400 [Apostichopus japonicus]|uniref:BROMI middle region domain-containing protein n=1 Tax=Stichopus japonicus TaxID=307972 RepID=A0A2G8LN56_STIJA|nr:hypothetical protein BSL78_01400 [Apostichopus japonicus]
MLQTLKIQTKDAVERLVRAYDDDSRQHSTNYQSIAASYEQRVMHSFSMSDDSSSLDSSFNQSAFLFMNQEHFVAIAENLEPGKPLDVRREAIQTLLQIPPSDVVACEQWDTLRASLLAALSDGDEILSDKSLRFHARMFSSNSHSVMREVYMSLVQHLSSCFSSSKRKVALIKDGVDVSDLETEVLLKKFRLMNEFQIEAESYWIRFPERFLDEVTEVTFDLLVTSPNVSSGMQKPLTPSHYLAVIDPKALWFKTWMHGDYSRTAVIQLASRNLSLVEDAVEHCLAFISSRMEEDAVSVLSRRLERQQLESGSRRCKYTEREVQFLYFYHCLSMLGRLLCYKNGRALFPLRLADDHTGMTGVVGKTFQKNKEGILNHLSP